MWLSGPGPGKTGHSGTTPASVGELVLFLQDCLCKQLPTVPNMPKRAWQKLQVQQEDGMDEGADGVRKRHGASPQQEAVALAARGAAQQATQVAHMLTDTAQAAVAAVQVQAAAAVVRQQRGSVAWQLDESGTYTLVPEHVHIRPQRKGISGIVSWRLHTLRLWISFAQPDRE